jgi:hypothetical protein
MPVSITRSTILNNWLLNAVRWKHFQKGRRQHGSFALAVANTTAMFKNREMSKLERSIAVYGMSNLTL